MTDRESLLRAILEEPGDDLPRHAFADWCEEQGDLQGDRPRAAFVRDQLLCDSLVKAGKGRSRACVEAHWRGYAHLHALQLARPAAPGMPEWHAEFAPRGRLLNHGVLSLRCGRSSMEYRRGFACCVAMEEDGFLRNAEMLFRSQPITEVRLVDRAPASLPGEVRKGWTRQPGFFYTLPEAIWNLLPGAEFLSSKEYTWSLHSGGHAGLLSGKEYTWSLHRDAIAALSHACVAYGRKLAGLPDLPLIPGAERASISGAGTP